MHKKILLITGAVLCAIYALFLLLPFILIPFINAFSSSIAQDIEKQTGFKIQIEKLRLVTTPKFTIGAKANSIKVFQPDENLLLKTENSAIKMSILPLLARKIELDLISADNIELNVYIKKDGSFLIEDFFKNTNSSENSSLNTDKKEGSLLPFGIKLSNKLPDIKIKKHSINLITDNKKDTYYAQNTKISDFVLNKRIKIETKGGLTIAGKEVFKHEINIDNKIMPDVDLNDLISNAQTSSVETKKQENQNMNILSILNLIEKYGVMSALVVDVKTNGSMNLPEIKGNINLKDFCIKPDLKTEIITNLALVFNKEKINIETDVQNIGNEPTKINGFIKTGKNPGINISCKSNANLDKIFKLSSAVLQIMGINDLKTLSAKGNLNADFEIEANSKAINSKGKFEIQNSSIKWGVYDLNIDNIIADILLDNNNVLINKLGFSVLSVPFSVTGNISKDAKCNIQIKTTKLPIKGLLAALGQAAILRENPISSGAVSMQAQISENLYSPKITGDVSLDNLNLYNIASDVKFSVNPVKIKLNSTKTGFEGEISAADIKAINPAITVSIPNMRAAMNEKQIILQDALVYAGANKTTLSGTISDYLTNKIALDFITKESAINASLKGNIDNSKQTLDLKFSIPEESTIIVPGFDKSKIIANGSTTIAGSFLNPILKGQFNVKSTEIPEIPVSISNMIVNLDGTILNGRATLENFSSGGIQASSVKTDLKMQDSLFYLNNMTGSAFDGTFKGDIAYDMASIKCGVVFSGEKMNALKAIEGAAGIKNALSGTLQFDADVNFKGVEYEDMMKTLTGKANFRIEKGVLANLGGLKSLLGAQNILSNSLLKTAIEKSSSLSLVNSASEFDYIDGSLTFNKGFANLSSVKMSGPSMAYYVTGKYNLLNGYTDVVILGRLSENVVGVLGNLGDLSSNKITSLISGLGNLTTSLAKSMNESPKNIDLTQIPSLSSNNSNTKDFKVVFNGPITGASSVKSFKWLNDVDTSQIETNSITNSVNQTVQDALNSVKMNASDTKESLKDTANQAKQMFKSFMGN